MLELICDQHYTWDNLPADSSPYHNPANALNTQADPGSGTIKFPHPNSRVLMEASAGGKALPAWNRLIALKIEVLARVDPQAARSPVLVAGNGSFRFGLLEGALDAGFNNASGNNNYVRSDASFSPDHKDHRVPTNKWVRLGFDHDGFAKMRLFIDNVLVGEAVIKGGIGPVHDPGVSIGNDVEQDGQQFPGEIKEVRIWRFDPLAAKRQLLSRRFTAEEAHCWEEFFEKINEWMNENPEKRRSLGQQVSAARTSFMRALFLLPETDQAKVVAALVAFGDLWSAGKINGPEMKKVLCDLVALLRGLGLDPGNDPAAGALVGAVGEMKIDRDAVLECDPNFAAFLQLLHGAVENCGKTPEVAS